jgi:hypothetical protein
MPNINRIMIDSRLRQVDSRSTSDFRIELPETIQMDDNMGCVVTDIVLPIAWRTIEPDVNDKLYLRIYPIEGDEYVDHIVTIPSRSYTRAELAVTLTAIFADRNIPLAANEDPFRNLLRIFLPEDDERSFMIFSDVDLVTRANTTWKGEYYSSTNPQSINNILGNSEFRMKVYNAENIFEGGSYNGLAHHTVYLVCPQLGNYRSIGPLGERDILKKIVIQANPLEIMTDLNLNVEDFADVSRLTLKSLSFRLTDVYGNIINLHGQNISFTLIFCPKNY